MLICHEILQNKCLYETLQQQCSFGDAIAICRVFR